MNSQDMKTTVIAKEKFQFAQLGDRLSDKKLETKPVGYLKDALIRFRKNKSSVIAAFIIAFLVLFAIVAPMISQYTLQDKDLVYQTKRPYAAIFAPLGFWDGGYNNMKNESDYLFEHAKFIETGHNPIIALHKEITEEVEVIVNGVPQKITRKNYDVRIDSYHEVGIIMKNLSAAEYEQVQAYQDATGRQIIYPLVNKTLLNGRDETVGGPNYWYCVDKLGKPELDKDGNFIPAYLDKTKPGQSRTDNYTSQRIKGDVGNYVYAELNQSGYSTRICYYEYYIYINGYAPTYLFGTTSLGQDLFCAIGQGARFSLMLAIVVSALNLTIGAIYGAIEGYYGGAIDMILERVSDVLSGVPFMVVATLFQMHLAEKVGVVVSFLFAFVMTGWIGMASLVRKQFYRFKGQEYILAAKSLGAGDFRIMFKHIFPNSLGTIITSCVLVIPGVISSETMMTYLGIVDLSGTNNTSIGTLLAQGNTYLTSAPHVLFWPSLFLALLLITFNLFGNGLRDAFNPSLRGAED
ncbi:MAG: ABC transporter permease [Clostridia bacterium]